MKYLFGLVMGVIVGMMLAIVLLYYNPLAEEIPRSSLGVSSSDVIGLNFSATAKDSIAYTNDGESAAHPYPAKILQLWEAPIRRSDALVTLLSDDRGDISGIGIKFTSDSERTRLIRGEALVDSVWHIHLPGRGSLFVAQTENYWNYLREVVVPARWSSSDSWKGRWSGNITVGPGPLGTAKVAGGSGVFSEVDAEAVEVLSARAYSVTEGPVSMQGSLTIQLPDLEVSAETEALSD